MDIVPWELYQKAQRRNQLPNTSPLNSEDRYSKLAISELRKVEVLCLALTAVSPFLGAALLRYATHFILGPEIISWFSTSLFVMATGIRPWSHLIERLNRRTDDLQNFIHHSPSSNHAPIRDLHKDIITLNNRIDKLERSFNGMKVRFKETSKEIFDHVDDALDSVNRSLQKHQKRWDEQDERLHFLKKSIVIPPELETSVGERNGLTTLPATAARSIFSKQTFYPLQWFGGKSIVEPWQSPILSQDRTTIPAQPERIRQENNMVAFYKFMETPVRLLHFLGFILFFPFRLAIRTLFWR